MPLPFKATLDKLRNPTQDIRLPYAKAAFMDSVPDVVDAMVARAVDTARGSGVSAQRAGERILETTGVLKAPDSAGVEDLAGIALRIYAGRQTRIAIGVDTTQAEEPRQLEALPEPKA